MNIADMRAAIDDAQTTLNRADSLSGDLARLLVGRLRKGNISPWVLGELKKELAKFNRHTGSWSDG